MLAERNVLDSLAQHDLLRLVERSRVLFDSSSRPYRLGLGLGD